MCEKPTKPKFILHLRYKGFFMDTYIACLETIERLITTYYNKQKSIYSVFIMYIILKLGKRIALSQFSQIVRPATIN